LTQAFPALKVAGSVRQAFDLRRLVIAAVGLVALEAGWSLLDRMVPSAAETTPDVIASSVPAIRFADPGLWSWATVEALATRLTEPARLLASSIVALVDPKSGWSPMTHALLSLVWLIVVWAICGGAIARIGVVHVAALRSTSIAAAIRFALTRAGSLILAPLCPLVGVVFCALIGAACGALYRLPWAGPALAGITLVIPLAAGLIAMLLLIGLFAGWPLFQAAIASGAEDAMDACSRVFGYLNQRLAPYAALVAFSALLGLFGLALIDFAAAAVIQLTHWSLGLTAPAALLAPLFGSGPVPATGFADGVHSFWLGLVRLIADGWVYSFFWTAAANIYLWLRYDVDGTPWTETEPSAVPIPEGRALSQVTDQPSAR
jgi:hypothetical protein